MWKEQLFTENPHPCWIFDPETLEFLLVNESFTKQYGYTRKQAENGMTILDIRPYQDTALLFDTRKTIPPDDSYTGTWRHIDKAGRQFYVEIYAQPIDFGGRQARYVMAVDVNNKVKALQRNRGLHYKVKANKQRMANILSSLNEAVWRIRIEDCSIKYINRASEQICGYTRNELKGMPISALQVYPDDMNLFKRAIVDLMNRGRANFECRMYHRDGTIKYLYHRCLLKRNAMAEAVSIEGITTDITEQRTAESQLWETNRRSHEIFESLTDAFFSVNENWQFTYINSICEELYNKKRKDVLGESIWEHFPHALESKFFTEMVRAMEERTVVEFEEYSPSRQAWIYAKAYPISDGIAVYFRDITEEHELRTKLIREELNRKSMVDNIADAIWAVDGELKLLSFNKAYYTAVQQYGHMPQEGESAIIPLPDPTIHKRWTSYYNQSLTGKKTTFLEEVVFKGYKIYARCNFGPVYDEAGHVTGVSCVARDVTKDVERVNRIEHQNSKLSNIAWIQSHKVRSPLTSIMGLMELFDKDNAGNEQNRQLLEYMATAVQQLDDVIREINEETKVNIAAPCAA